jgi:hypothetical protein
MTSFIVAFFGLWGVAFAEEPSDSTTTEDDTVSMEWEELPETDPPNAWIGLGVSLGSDALVYGGAPVAAGLDFRWVLTDPDLVLGFTHRTWRSPSPEFESELAAQGVTEGVQNFWAGRMRLSVLYRFITPGSGKVRGGFQLGPSLLRTKHVGAQAQRYLKRQHDLQWGPRWTAAVGPEVHMGIFGEEERLQLTFFGRYHAPFAARHNQAQTGMVLDGHLYNPVELVQKEADIGGLLGLRADPFYVQLEVASRVFGPSEYDRVAERLWWRGMVASDLSLGVAF